MAVQGTAGLTLTTNDGGKNGALTFTGKGSVAFWDLSSSLIVNANAYTLVNTIATLASDIAASKKGNFALAASYNAKSDGTYTKAPIKEFAGKFEGLGNTISNLKIKIKTRDREGADDRSLGRGNWPVRSRRHHGNDREHQYDGRQRDRGRRDECRRAGRLAERKRDQFDVEWNGRRRQRSCRQQRTRRGRVDRHHGLFRIALELHVERHRPRRREFHRGRIGGRHLWPGHDFGVLRDGQCDGRRQHHRQRRSRRRRPVGILLRPQRKPDDHGRSCQWNSGDRLGRRGAARAD